MIIEINVSPILSTTTGDKRGKARHKEVKTWERHLVVRVHIPGGNSFFTWWK